LSKPSTDLPLRTATDDRPAVDAAPALADEPTRPSGPPEEAARPQPDVIAGRYRVERELGRGGMGLVFAAHDDRLGRRVAVKLLLGGAQDEQRLRRFEQEARAAGGINHPGILTVHDVVATDDGPCIVSELLEGETLRQLLSRGPLPFARAAELARQLAEGLVAAHAKGVVHRDLKPANVFVTTAGVLKVLDFGIAKLVEPGREGPHTETGAVLGTVGYMSPEQVRGEPADHRSDLFAAGVMLHEMLIGASPFQAPSRHQIEERILHSQPDSLPSSVPEGLQRIVLRCLEKDPRRRFQSAAELAERLAEVRAQPERPPSLLGDLRRRRVFRALLAYGIVAFGVLQVAETIVHGLRLPDWTVTLVVVAAGLGFPLTLALAWLFDLTRGGIVRTAPAPGDSGVRGVKLVLTLGAMGVVAGLPVIGWKLVERGRPAAKQQAHISPDGGRLVVVVADFVNETGEKDLGGLSGMLMTALEQSPRLSVLTQARMFDTLKQLGKGHVERIDESLGREVARKARADALVHASIRRFGVLYSIDLKVLDPVKSEYLFAAKEEAQTKESVPGMLDRLSARLRERYEKQEQIRASSAPVVKSTTANLEAYRHLFMGEQRMARALTREDFQAAADEVRKAVKLDPNFALAHFWLWRALMWVDRQAGLAQQGVVEKMADQLPERARCILVANDHSGFRGDGMQWLREVGTKLNACAERFPDDRDILFAAGDHEYHSGDRVLASDLLERVLSISPEYEPAAWHQRLALRAQRRFDRLVKLARDEVQRTHSERAYLHLAHALFVGGDKRAGEEALRETARLYPESGGPEVLRLGFHIAAGEPVAAEAEMARLASRGSGGERAGRVRAARNALDAYRGRFRALLSRMEAVAAGSGEAAVSAAIRIAWVHSLGRGDMAAARRATAAAKLRGAPENLLFFAHFHAGDVEAAGRLLDAAMPGFWVAAAKARASGRPAEAMAIYQSLSRGQPDDEALALFWLSEAALKANQPKTAIDALHKLQAIGPQDDWWEGGSTDMTVAVEVSGFPALWQGRTFHLLGRAHEMAGEPATALAAYEKFLRIWSDADDDLPWLVDARTRKAALSGFR